MNSRLALSATVAVAFATLTGLATVASAADIDPYDVPKAGSPYDDPRYGDIYRHPTPPPRYAEPRYEPPRYEPPRHAPPRYAERYDEPAPRPYVHRDRRGYLEPMNPPHTYRDYDRHSPRTADACVPRREVRRNLVEQGWSDFQDAELAGDTATVRARRPSGRQFELRVDRCSGEILEARPIHLPERHYSWRDRPGYRAY